MPAQTLGKTDSLFIERQMGGGGDFCMKCETKHVPLAKNSIHLDFEFFFHISYSSVNGAGGGTA